MFLEDRDSSHITVICALFKYYNSNLIFHGEDIIARQASHLPRRDRRLKYWIAGVFEKQHLRYTTSRGIHDLLFEVPRDPRARGDPSY